MLSEIEWKGITFIISYHNHKLLTTLDVINESLCKKVFVSNSTARTGTKKDDYIKVPAPHGFGYVIKRST